MQIVNFVFLEQGKMIIAFLEYRLDGCCCVMIVPFDYGTSGSWSTIQSTDSCGDIVSTSLPKKEV